MKKYFFVYLLLIISCQDNKNDDLVIDPSQLQGDWISKFDKLSFWDSAVSDPIYFDDRFLPFTVHKDTIRIAGQMADGYKVRYDIKVAKLDYDSLVFLYDTLVFKYGRAKLLDRHIPDFQEIQFSSGVCLGPCPIINIIIKSNGDIFYQGKSFSELPGNYVGTASQKNINRIRNFLGLYDLNMLESTEKKYRTTDNPSYALYIKLMDGKEVIVTGSMSEDYPDLASRFLEFYKYCNLIESDEEIIFITEKLKRE
jgi:uncharacterized protein DUF6438